MKYIATSLLKLVIVYFLIIFVSQIAFANLQARSIDESNYNWSNSIQHAGNLQWKQLKMVELSIWIFNNKIHYVFIVLISLVLYYYYKDSNLKPPAISRVPKKDVQTYEEQKKKLTQQQLSKLVNSDEYKRFEKNKKWDDDLEQEQTDGDWDRFEQQIYDQ